MENGHCFLCNFHSDAGGKNVHLRAAVPWPTMQTDSDRQTLNNDGNHDSGNCRTTPSLSVWSRVAKQLQPVTH